MPIYERKCQRCEVVSSHLSKVADRNAPKVCPQCGCPETIPIMSPTKTNFKFADKSPFK